VDEVRPRLEPGAADGLEDPPVAVDLVGLELARRPRLEPGPLEGDAQGAQPVLRQQRRVLGVAGGEPVAVA
jgi:hypothetical protein